MPTPKELEAAVKRADRNIGWMASHIGRMAPPDGGLAELNDHWLFIERNGWTAKAPWKRRGEGRPLDQRAPAQEQRT